MDLNKLKHLEETNNIKVNTSEIARELGVDRRTVRKYIDGYSKPKSRNKISQFDAYEEIIRNLLNDEHRIFHYKSILWRYLCENHNLSAPESSFRRYISGVKEFNDYFVSKTLIGVKSPSPLRYETAAGQQAQLDWKESMTFILKNGEPILINIFVLLLSYSRFRVYRLSLSKTQDILLNFLDESFSIFGGVPREILCDNMKTIMDESRTEYRKGHVNARFQQFADDYGFEVSPCIAGRPQTKAKVESPMRILDELQAYSGHLTYEELALKLRDINNRENSQFHKGYDMVPTLGLRKEKDALTPLPQGKLRHHYQMKINTVKVNKSSMITVQTRQYSVPPEYIGKHLIYQCIDNQIHVYHNTNLITIHQISTKKLNYHESHYIQIAKQTLTFKDDKIEEIAKENLKMIGERYEHN